MITVNEALALGGLGIAALVAYHHCKGTLKPVWLRRPVHMLARSIDRVAVPIMIVFVCFVGGMTILGYGGVLFMGLTGRMDSPFANVGAIALGIGFVWLCVKMWREREW